GAPLYSDFGGITGLSGGEMLVSPALVGDLNLDNTLSIADFIDLSSHFGQTSATWSDGDINFDNQVTIADFIDLAAHFGQTDAVGVAAAVPEPATLAIATVVVIAF